MRLEHVQLMFIFGFVNMNIDKFGHHVHKRLRVSEYFDVLNDALVKSDTGDYDLKLARLRGLPSPIFQDEVVNKQYIDTTLKQLYSKREIQDKIKSEVDLCLNYFKDKLYATLTSSYYSKPEIDKIIGKIQNKT